MNDWECLYSEPVPNGTPGCDGAVSDYISVRWVNRKRGAMITSSWYVVDLAERNGLDKVDDAEQIAERFGDNVFDVEQEIEYLVCGDLDDPGATEVASDIQYRDDLTLNGFASKSEAEAYALNQCAQELTPGRFERDYQWSGRAEDLR